MFRHINSASIIVSDQDRAKDFYVNTLGMVLRSDEEMYPGASTRWLTVAPSADATSEILLEKPDEQHLFNNALIGKTQSTTIAVSDLLTLVETLKAKGVEFDGEPDVQPWGSGVYMYDPDRNRVYLIELPTG